MRTTVDKSRGNRATATATHGTGTVVAVGTVLAGASTGLDLEGIFYNGGTKIAYVVHIFTARRKVKKQEKVKKQDKIKEILKRDIKGSEDVNDKQISSRSSASLVGWERRRRKERRSK
ncbi:MAG: hypothetical protein OCU12_04475 [Methanophagales archaeon]|nr:hypothetical protein [Methanophagales archaeon]